MRAANLAHWLDRPARLTEEGLDQLAATLRAAQLATRELAQGGPIERSPDRTAAPGQLPRNVDTATAELANRLTRLARSTPRSAIAYSRLLGDTASALRHSFGFVFALPRRQRWSALLELPFSVATLAVQEALRGLLAAQAVPSEQIGDLASFVVEVFGDLDTYFGLRYQDELERYRRHLERHPDDSAARLELGRIYLKCGLFREADPEFALAANDPWRRRQALYQKTVASYHRGDFATAVGDAVDCLSEAPEDLRARWWLWLASRETGGYPAVVPPAMRFEVSDGFHPSKLRFTDVAAEIGLDKTAGGRGSAIFDATGDGYLDVVLAGTHSSCGLYLNNGDGTFVDATIGSGLESCVYGFALLAADFDSDGRRDLLVTSMGFFDGECRLLHNQGGGRFVDVTHDAGLGGWGPTFTAAWGDYDGDGQLDLFMVNNLGGLFDRKTPNRLLRNRGDGTFTEVAAEAGLLTPWPSLGCAWGDFWNRGRQDLFVSNLGRAQLFSNNGDGTFADVSRQAGIDRPAIGSVVLVLDFDNDGWLDILQFTYSRPEDAIHTLRHGCGPPGGAPPRLFRNNRNGTFTDVAAAVGLTGCWGTMSAAVGDFANSGHPGLWLGNGDPSMDRTEPTILYENDGQRFHNITFTAGLPFTGKGHGANLADLAGDGRLHLLVASGGLYPGDLLTTAVYRPVELPGRYLNVRLVGSAGNRDAFGARLVLDAGGRRQHRLISGGTGFGCPPTEQHFGLGAATIIASLEVRWPNGERQCFADLPLDTTLEITAGRDGWRLVYQR